MGFPRRLRGRYSQPDISSSYELDVKIVQKHSRPYRYSHPKYRNYNYLHLPAVGQQKEVIAFHGGGSFSVGFQLLLMLDTGKSIWKFPAFVFTNYDEKPKVAIPEKPRY
ncbi:hypothetical protein JCM33374_g2017 [Metschnikowia sp. JCM 33374]|nr:hypothetical protein JCM33374_g2017 [Metschnikowia sp. JCM 33374]